MSIPYLVQNGAHGSSTTLGQLAHNGVIINLAALNRVTFNGDKTLVSLEGGSLMSEVIQSAYSNSALVLSGICNCTGYLGALLGGGFGYLIGQYGLMLDNIVSLNVVLASGQAISVTPSDEDLYVENLWWAMRGAGPNFGAVPSAVVKSYPVDSNALNAWLGPLLFEDTQLDTLIQTMNDITLEPEMAMSLTFASSWNASASSPSIILTVFYHGTEAQGKAA